MQAAARLGYSINVNQVGSDSTSTRVSSTISPIDGTKEWQQSFTIDEDGILHQLRATLVQSIDAACKFQFHQIISVISSVYGTPCQTHACK